MPRGWIADRQAHHCIEMRIEAPGQEPKCVIVPLPRTRTGWLNFGEQWEGPQDFKGPPTPMAKAKKGRQN